MIQLCVLVDYCYMFHVYVPIVCMCIKFEDVFKFRDCIFLRIKCFICHVNRVNMILTDFYRHWTLCINHGLIMVSGFINFLS